MGQGERQGVHLEGSAVGVEQRTVSGRESRSICRVQLEAVNSVRAGPERTVHHLIPRPTAGCQ